MSNNQLAETETIEIVESSLQEQSISVRQATKNLVIDSLPNVIATFLFVSARTITLIFLKRYHSETLSGSYGLSNNFIDLLGMGSIFALSVGLLSKIAPAYGAKEYRLIGYYLHRGFFIHFFVFCIIALLLGFSKQIFRLIGYDNELSEDVSTYLVYAIPGLFFYMIFSTLM